MGSDLRNTLILIITAPETTRFSSLNHCFTYLNHSNNSFELLSIQLTRKSGIQCFTKLTYGYQGVFFIWKELLKATYLNILILNDLAMVTDFLPDINVRKTNMDSKNRDRLTSIARVPGSKLSAFRSCMETAEDGYKKGFITSFCHAGVPVLRTVSGLQQFAWSVLSILSPSDKASTLCASIPYC